MKKTSILFFLLAISSQLFSQNLVAGKVTDESGVPLAGVTIIIKGTTTGIITGTDGMFTIPDVPENSILQFSYVGMKTQEIAFVGQSMIDLILKEDRIGIEEVVAVGYGIQKRTTMTGAIAAVKGEAIKTVNVTNLSNSIGGQVSGLIAASLPV